MSRALFAGYATTPLLEGRHEDPAVRDEAGDSSDDGERSNRPAAQGDTAEPGSKHQARATQTHDCGAPKILPRRRAGGRRAADRAGQHGA